ncbi:hypothetical protein PF003_g37254 [Phytophthora fragariae]|uniref:Uncharacterized protein n=1 Tax=Phytophthora fragariae TaxID=53985 RepID=A0A6A3FKZ2_9STRA|nr:hypothetical protein PF003_g37254 [Phytophthora fragariae]KAE8945852.1 hypothetical protein PF009_g4497 [Phytophthora fragariae]
MRRGSRPSRSILAFAMCRGLRSLLPPAATQLSMLHCSVKNAAFRVEAGSSS